MKDIKIIPRFFKGDTVYFLEEMYPGPEKEIVVEGKKYKADIISAEEAKEIVSERIDMAMRAMGYEKQNTA